MLSGNPLCKLQMPLNCQPPATLRTSGLERESLHAVYQVGCVPHVQQLRLVLVDVRLRDWLASSRSRRVERPVNRGEPKGSIGDIQAPIDAAVAEVHAAKSRIKANAVTRMIPSVAPKEQPIPFRP